MEFAYKLSEMLAKSIEKNGNKELTMRHLLNIVNFCIKSIEIDDIKHQQILDDISTEMNS